MLLPYYEAKRFAELCCEDFPTETLPEAMAKGAVLMAWVGRHLQPAVAAGGDPADIEAHAEAPAVELDGNDLSEAEPDTVGSLMAEALGQYCPDEKPTQFDAVDPGSKVSRIDPALFDVILRGVQLLVSRWLNR